MLFGALVLPGCGALSVPMTAVRAAALPVHDADGTPLLSTTYVSGDTKTKAKGDLELGVGVGFTGSPGTAMLGGQLDYYLNEHYAVGGLVQLGYSSDDTLVAPSFNVMRVFDLHDIGDFKWRPFAQGGIGFAYMERDVPGGSVDDSDLMLNVGGGVELYLDDGITARSSIMLNYMPGEVLGDKSFISWQVVQFQFRF